MMKFKVKKRKREAVVNGSMASNVFGDEDEDEQGGQQDNEAEEEDHNNYDKKKARQEMNERLKQMNEANLQKLEQRDGQKEFDYDDVYDEMKAKQATTEILEEQGDGPKKSKYIDSLLEHAKRREMEHERNREMLKRKELEAENEVLGPPTEVFMTSGYKEKLEEQQRWVEEENRQQEMEDDVTKKQPMGGANYDNLLHDLASGEPSRKEPSSTKTDEIQKIVEIHKKKTPRQAPPSRVTQEEILAARARYFERQRNR